MRYDAKFISIREAAAVEGTSFSSMRRRLHEASKSTPELLDLGNPNGSVNVEVFRRVILERNRNEERETVDVRLEAVADIINDVDKLKSDVARIKRILASQFAGAA